MEYVMHNLGNELVELGHDVTVIAIRASWRRPAEHRKYDLRRYSLPIKGAGKIGLNLAGALLTVALEHRKKHFDLIHCHGVSRAGTWARYLKNMLGIPVVMTPHGEDIQKIPAIGYGMRLDSKWDKIITRNIRAADAVTAISRSIRQDIDMIEPEKIFDVPNGIDTSRFTGARSDYLQRRLGLDSNDLVILSVGRSHVKKGYAYGIHAVSKIVNELGYKGIRFVIVGRNTKDLRTVVDECSAGSFISLLEEVPVERVADCYRSADIYFSPSIAEGLSLVSVEAMASGLPLVVTNVPGNEDIVQDNGCGIIVESENTDSMAEGLVQLIDNEGLRQGFSSISLQRSSAYDWRNITHMYEQVYLNVVSRNQDT
jgi:glycosyltransferase involved in cell wall biosynthesis